MRRRLFVTGGLSFVSAIAFPNLLPRSLSPKAGTAFANPTLPKQLTSDDIKWIMAKAIMRTVAQAEGAWWPGREEEATYKTLFGGGLFNSYADHPDTVICVPGQCGKDDGICCSSAAGAYQFMPYTWYPLRSRYSQWYAGDKFSPANQDLGFLRLYAEIGALWRLEKGITVLHQKVDVKPDAFRASVAHSANCWCSLPGTRRGECAGQPQRSWNEVEDWFYTQLKAQQVIAA